MHATSAATAIALDDCIKAHQKLQESDFLHYMTYGEREAWSVLERVTNPMGHNRMVINQAITGDLTCHDSL